MSAEMQRELKPCPICGGKAHAMQEDHQDVRWVGCEPGGCVATDTHLELEDAIAVWNRRSQGQEGWKLAMRVMQSDLYSQLDDAERAECDALARTNPCFPAPSGEVKE